MSTDRRLQTARVWFDEVINNRDVDAIYLAYAADYVHRSPGDHVMGRDGAIEVGRRLLASSHDRHAEVLDQVTDGDAVVTRFRATGTWSETPPGHRTAGVAYEVHGMVISRFDEDGRIVEDWEIIDVRDRAT